MLWLSLGCVIRSGLGIPAQEQFVLGDNPHGAFRVTVTNDGDVPVALVTSAGGAVVSARALAPGEAARARFSPEQAAIFVNDADQEASLSVRVRGDVGLSMGYTLLP